MKTTTTLSTRLLARLSALAIALALQVDASCGAKVGLPFSRTYPLDEIGVSRNVRLDFDPIGRIAAIDGKRFVVLNDTTWINLTAENEIAGDLHAVKSDASQGIYFGALADWGQLSPQKDGKLVSESFRPANAPSWVNSTNFEIVLVHSTGIFFAGYNGIVHWNRETREQTFFEAASVARLFKLGSKVYMSSHRTGLSTIDLRNRRLVPLPTEDSRIVVIDKVAPLSDGRAVISTTGQRLALFDGNKIEAWPNDLKPFQPAHISNVLSLPDGGIAISVDGKGLYILSESGECQRAFAHEDYHAISKLVSREPGVLWVATEEGIEKLLYNDPVSILDQRSGMPINWPEAVEWKGQPLVASHGALYQIEPGLDGISSRFKRWDKLPILGIAGIAAIDEHLLIANGDGVQRWDGSQFIPIVRGISINHLVPIGNDLCVAIGSTVIAILQRDGQDWVEAAPRHEGIGFPYLSLATKHSAWIELGANRVARICLRNGQIQTKVFEDFPWSEIAWVHAGFANGLVVLKAQEGVALYYDEETESFVDDPELSKLFRTAPTQISRLLEDQKGTLWAAYEHGVYAIHRSNDGFDFDMQSFRTIRDSYPILKLSNANDLWVYSGTTLSHIETNYVRQTASQPKAILVSLKDSATNEFLYSIFDTNKQPQTLPYTRNDLEFQFFTGSYSFTRSLGYEFTMSTTNNDWTTRSSVPSITLSNLKEGEYQLTQQAFEGPNAFGNPVVSNFTIQPPWHRSTTAYLLYWSVGLLGISGIVSLAVRASKRKRYHLEKLVRERTEELRATMAKLTEEARHSATLAERNRLAGEIHDSLQQGLSGLALQLEATLKLNNLNPDIQSRLSVARRMVSFTRQEVQQAVWDLESPLLEDNDLADALRTIASLVGADPSRVDIESNVDSAEIPSNIKHHLLRIAQEAMTNAVRHSGAKRIRVRLNISVDLVTLEINDDGQGFDPNEIFSNGIGHFGLRGIRTRASKINGRLRIESALSKGTQIHLTVPLDPISETQHERQKN